MDWKLSSYIGLDEILFGMSAGAVAQIIGPPARHRTMPSGKRRETRDKQPFIMYHDDGVTEIELFLMAGRILLQDVYVETSNRNDLLERLLKLDTRVYEGAGALIFFDLGLSTNMFHDVDAPSATAFARGTWDQAMPRLKPFDRLGGPSPGKVA